MGLEAYEIQQAWTEIASLTAVVTTPAVGARDAATVEALANVVVWSVPQGLPSLRFRHRTNIADNSTGVYDILTVRQNADGQDYYNRAATITVTSGTQVADTGYTFCDAVVVSNSLTNQEIKAVTGTGNYIGELLMNTEGISKIAFVPITLTGTKILDIDMAKGSYKHIFLKA